MKYTQEQKVQIQCALINSIDKWLPTFNSVEPAFKYVKEQGCLPDCINEDNIDTCNSLSNHQLFALQQNYAALMLNQFVDSIERMS